jgi:outer membrane biosynthesis protein TonB
MLRPVWNDTRAWTLRNPLVAALLLSLAFHLLIFGVAELGDRLGLWKRLATLTWVPPKLTLVREEARQKALAAQQARDIPLMFVEVDPALAVKEPPKDAKFYSSASTVAANPDATVETERPKIDGRQDKVMRTFDAPKPQPFPLQPAAPPEQKEIKTQTATPPQAKPAPGETLAKAATTPTLGKDALQYQPKDEQPARERPRTLAAARAQNPSIAGEKSKQDGGVKRRGGVALDVKGTPFGIYDAEFIAAVQQRWHGLLEERQTMAMRSGKVVLNFKLTYNGRIDDMQILASDVGDILALLCRKAVEGNVPYRPWPGDMRRLIGADFREVTFTFYYY